MKKALLLIILFWSVTLFSQEEQSNDVKVGVVLSGGGAKGLAHIGVLKEIEKSGLRIDYIGGTSMGAIVGGLYASGYTAHQLDSLFNAIDFDALIQDDIPRNAKTFYEKSETEKYAVTLPFDDFVLSFPSGISKGQNIYNLFSKLTAHVSEVHDFNKLPIPFFCMATNIETGEAVKLNKGYLPRAITASGALPSLFSPVTINDTIYVDGGVVNNYPVDEVKAMGADIVIGVDVQDSLRDRTRLKSVVEIVSQISNFRTINAMKEKAGRTDIYIKPNIEDFTVVSFNEGAQIIHEGEEEAQLFVEEFKKIAAKQSDKRRKQVIIPKSDSLFINSIHITGNKKYTRAYVLGKLKLRTPANTSYAAFNEGINNLSATGNFQNINYKIKKDHNGLTYIDLELVENPSKMFLRFGAHYDELFKTAALINLTRKRLITNNDILSVDAIIGDNIRYNIDYYIDKGFYWSIGFKSRFSSFEEDVGIDFLESEGINPEDFPINKLDLNYRDLTNQIYVQTISERRFLLGVGGEHKWLKYLTETIGIDENNIPRTVFEDTHYFSTYGFIKYDTYTDKFYPNKGFLFEGDFHLYLLARGANKDFEQFSIAKAKAGYAHTFFKKLALVFTSEGGFKIGPDATQSLDFFVGGYGFKSINNIKPLYGYEALDLRGNTYLKSVLTLDYEIFKNNHINISGNIANVGDDLFENGEWIDRINYSGVAFGYGIETFLGPIEAKYSFSPEHDDGHWYFSVGFRF